MGIPGLDRKLWSIEGCVTNVSVKELVEKYEKNVIVVDGFNFYGLYLYPKFDWICGAFRELVQEIRLFVESFERIGVKLVFFFVEGNLDEGSDRCGSDSWIERRSECINYTQMVFRQSRNVRYLQKIKSDRAYYHTPLNALPVVLFALQHIMNCEVHFVYSGDREDSLSYYSGNNNCLAILCQDNYYIFYHMVPRYLSIKQLNLEKMTTVQYCPKVLAQHRNLGGHLFPMFFKDESPTSDETEILFQIGAKLDECESKDDARKKIEEYFCGKKIEEVLDVGALNTENVSKSNLKIFLFQILRYKLGFHYKVVYGPSEKWDLIKLQAQELYASGEISRYIERILMTKKFFNDCILEDFTELPPSSELYQSLRTNLYIVLFSEEPRQQAESDNSDSDSETSDGPKVVPFTKHLPAEGPVGPPGPADIWEKKFFCMVGHTEQHKCRIIFDWHMRQRGDPSPEMVLVKRVLHPGLLLLWRKNNITSNITEIKWKMFTSCISDTLQWQLLSVLPPTLVVPTVVLYYLFQVVPLRFKTKTWNFLQTWEVEVFIALAVMLSKIDTKTLSTISIETLNSRVVNLIAFFVYGCHHVRLLIEACGHPISEHDLCVFHYFDGKLFHSFYNRAEWRRNGRNLCDQETYPLFEKMRQIIIPEPVGRC